MSAGESAMNEAERAARAAERFEQKAAGARKRADAFAAGGAGEKRLAEVLAPLGPEGWFFLHDRVNPFGGNIDTIAIGPAGVIVMDAKAWNGQLTVTADRLKVGGWSKAVELQKVLDQAIAVQRAIGDEVGVSCGLVFTTQPEFGPAFVAGVTLVGTDHLLGGLRVMPGQLTAATIDRYLRVVSEAFPPAGTAPSAASGQKVVDGESASMQFDRANRLMYVTPWKKSGKHRLYLRTDMGEQLGYRDVNAASVHLEPSADHPFARMVLTSTTPTGLVIDPKSIPKVKLEMPAGRLLAVMGKLWVSAVVGQVWRRNGKKLLFGTLANPKDGVIKLGYVDLETGWIKPESAGDLGEYLGPAEKYLVQLRDRFETTTS